MATKKSRKRPQVLLRCTADMFAGAKERVIEVSSPGGGCLISLETVEGELKGGGKRTELHISVYRADATVVLMKLGRNRG